MAGNVLEFTDGNFQAEVLESDQPVLVDFWAPWCGPCRMLAPTVEELAGEYAGQVKVGKVNTDENIDVASTYAVSSIPTVLIFKGGNLVERIVGLSPKNEFKKSLDKALA